MRRALLLLIAVLCASGETVRYELRGRLLPAMRASVWLHGATAPFEDSTLTDDAGHFRFRGLLAGAYTLAAYVPGRGEARRTIEIGPSQADAQNRIELTVELRDQEFESRESLRRENIVSAHELAIPDSARKEYEEAEKCLARRDVDAAGAHFQRAVELAPKFSEAWNHLGTIAYQTRDYARAESCFHKALAADPTAFQPLVNLGGVSINLGKFEESLKYNLYAALTRPGDALANSQLGMSYYFLDKLDLARKYLATAKQLDPAHFSHPQLLLAQIDLRQANPAAAAAELAEFLQYHPDSPEAGKVRQNLAQLRADPPAPRDPAQALAATGMARSFSETPELPPFDGAPYSVVHQDGRDYLGSRDAQGKTVLTSIDATCGSGRHARILLNRTADGGWKELPLAWLAGDGGHYAAAPAFEFSAKCLACHARQNGGHPTAIGCVSCHGTVGSGKPGETVCLECHPGASGPESAHGVAAASDDKFELNSAGYRLLESHCYRASAGKLTCITCHPPHSFAKTAAEVRMVCRGCHPDMHGGAALDCAHCHMPMREARDAPGMLVTDHRIQRPL
ncbi:MAG: tetratricopeptide repeat protein [Bryobacteraceae bacterium]